MLRRSKRAPVAPKEDKLDALFNQYKEADADTIGPVGVEQLCADLKTDPSDRKVLLLAWKMDAQRMGYFSREEWHRGLGALGVATIDKLRKALPGLVEEVEADDEAFKVFFAFSFKYLLMEPRQRIIDIESALQMLQIAMPASEPHLAPFCEFLESQSEYKALNLDQWNSFLRFCQEVSPDCSDYDESSAWPLLLDNYVEWRRQQGT